MYAFMHVNINSNAMRQNNESKEKTRHHLGSREEDAYS
jgi:hypothetical protein